MNKDGTYAWIWSLYTQRGACQELQCRQESLTVGGLQITEHLGTELYCVQTQVLSFHDLTFARQSLQPLILLLALSLLL